MRLRQLEVFEAVMESGTTVGAAGRLNMSQSSVSSAIANLEADFGVQLFRRFKGRLEPTEEARILHAQSLKVFEEVATTRNLVQRLKDASLGTLRVAATAPLGDTLLPKALGHFIKDRPEIQVKFMVGSLDYVNRALELGEVDLAVFLVTMSSPSISVTRLCTLDSICAIPEGHPLCVKSVITPEDITNVPLISLGFETPFGAMVNNAFLNCDVECRIAYEVRTAQSASRLVAEGLGVAIVDSFNLLTRQSQPGVQYRLFEPRITTPAYVAHASNRPFPRLARLFVDSLSTTARRAERQMSEIAN